jgi:adenine-specific DNA-methyltransferase
MEDKDINMSQPIEILKKHFANCFDKDGNFIPSRLQEVVQDNGIGLSKESYHLNWLGKSYARLLANESIQTLIQEDVEHNRQPVHAASQNLLIKGDNLEVLKHLRGAYSEQVKMIYIDPPYNTGSDGFVYQDDRKFTPEQLSELAGIDEDEAKRILEFTSSHSNSHSAWLTFMYPRLYVARQLLADDGVIFISIDDSEQAQLKVLCDEVFGEENFVDTLIWKKIYGGKNDSKWFLRFHDYIFVYSKNKNLWFPNLLKRTDKQNDRYKNPDNDIRGPWKSGDFTGVGETKSCVYEIITPSGRVINPPTGKRWIVSQETYLELKNDNRIWFGQTGDNVPSIKRFLTEVKDGVTQSTILDYSEVGHSDGANKDLKKLLDGSFFDYPKPVGLIERLIHLGTSSSDTVIDFFAGSGTTADAVMQLNAEDGGSRRFIGVQIDEATDPSSEAHKAGYSTIFDITKARITKAATKIQSENPKYQGDLGFKIFETKPIFDQYLDAPDTLTENLTLFDANKLSQEDRHSLMRTWALRDNIKLTIDLKPIKLADYTAYSANKTLYFIEPNLSLDAIIVMLEQLDHDPNFAPNRLVVLGYLLDTKVQREMTEALHHYNNRKGIELTLDIRYN